MGSDNFAAFRDYLAAKSAVNKKYVDYYVRWISSCYDFLDLPQGIGFIMDLPEQQ